MDLLAGRYRLVQLLGRGGMAEVWDAVDERLGRPVAVKLLAPELAAQADFRARFEQEARASARLSHPNVVAVYDTGEEDDRPFLVMERHDGETLATRLERGRLADDAARRVGSGVLAALGAAHAAGIVHRDIKPANILLDPDGTPKVADFGIAKLADPAGGANGTGHRTATNVIVGTPAYLAPERVEGKPATPATDVYSLGVVLYEALSGAKPFRGDTPVAVALAARAGAAPLRDVRPDLDGALVATVERAMDPDPTRRFPSAEAMSAALDGNFAAPPTTRAANNAPPTAVLAGPRRRFPVPALAVVVLLALVGLGLMAQGFLARGGTGSAAAAGAPAALVVDLRALAARLDAPDGTRADEARAGLLDVAARLERGDASGAAGVSTRLATQIRQWSADRDLGRTATTESLALLARVPGADVTASTAVTTSVTVASTADADEKPKDDKKRPKGHD